MPSPSWLSIAILSIIAHNYAVESNLQSECKCGIILDCYKALHLKIEM